AGFTSTPKEWSHLLDAGKAYTYGALGDVQANQGRMHQLRVWAKRTAGWKLIVYQEVLSLEAPPTVTPGAGKDCENPCKMVPYQPKNATEHAVIAAYSRLETAAMAHNSPVFATLVADEFIAASSNSNKLYDKRGRMQDFDRVKLSGVAPTPLVSAQFDDFGDAVLMRSRHMPDVGHPLRVTRIWVRRDGRWMEAVSYQTSITDQYTAAFAGTSPFLHAILPDGKMVPYQIRPGGTGVVQSTELKSRNSASEASQTGRTLLNLRGMLLRGDFQPGERLSELPLVARLGVSRTPIRLALDRLAHEGLLEASPTGGFVVRSFTIEDVWDAIETRGVLEGAAARLAA